MKILIINSWELDGGAARAANRLHKALLSKNIDSQMLVMKKVTDDSSVLSPFSKIGLEYNKLLPSISALPIIFYNKTRKRVIFSPQFMARDLSKMINTINPDVVHIHWVNGGFMSLKTLGKVDAPVILTMHDNWLFTGGCHVMNSCQRYKESCGKCPVLGSNKENDLSKKTLTKKKKVFSTLGKITITSPSKWMANCAKDSAILKNKRITNLPNLINTNIFKPFDKGIARDILNLPKDKKIILFGAMHSSIDENKGYAYLKTALDSLTIENLEVVVFGSSESRVITKNYKTTFFGNIFDDITLALLYSASDVVVVPSKQENLSNVIMESLSCATPVVAFNIGGNSDMIRHKRNGYLARPFSHQDLLAGIKFILNDNCGALGDYSRNSILESFSSDVLIKKYIKMYESLI